MNNGQIAIKEYKTGNISHKWDTKKIKTSHKILAKYYYEARTSYYD